MTIQTAKGSKRITIHYYFDNIKDMLETYNKLPEKFSNWRKRHPEYSFSYYMKVEGACHMIEIEMRRNVQQGDATTDPSDCLEV